MGSIIQSGKMWPEALNGKRNPVRNTKAERPACVQQDFMLMPCRSQTCKQHPTIGPPATSTLKPTLESLISFMWSFVVCGIGSSCLCLILCILNHNLEKSLTATPRFNVRLWSWPCLLLYTGYIPSQYVSNWMWSHSVTLGSSDCPWPKHRTGSSVLARSHFLFPGCLPSLWFWWPRHSAGELQGLLASMAFA